MEREMPTFAFSSRYMLLADMVALSCFTAWYLLRGRRRTNLLEIKHDEGSPTLTPPSAAPLPALQLPTAGPATETAPLVELPDLSADEAAALAKIRERCKLGGLFKRIDPFAAVAAESRDAYLYRFLRARKMNPKDALEMIVADLEWREKLDINALASRPAEELLGCPISAVWPWAPNWIQGVDRKGRPVIYKEWGQLWIFGL